MRDLRASICASHDRLWRAASATVARGRCERAFIIIGLCAQLTSPSVFELQGRLVPVRAAEADVVTRRSGSRNSSFVAPEKLRRASQLPYSLVPDWYGACKENTGVSLKSVSSSMGELESNASIVPISPLPSTPGSLAEDNARLSCQPAIDFRGKDLVSVAGRYDARQGVDAAVATVRDNRWSWAGPTVAALTPVGRRHRDLLGHSERLRSNRLECLFCH